MAHKNKSNVSPMKGSQGRQHRKPTVVYGVEEANDRLYDIFRNHGFGDDIGHAERRKLAQFYVLLMETQKKENFTRLLTLKDVAIRHYIDCLMVLRLTDLKFPLLDVGTGPGFPGIPLKIMRPDDTIMLAESVQRRVDFLKLVRDELELKNLPIVGRQINRFFAYPVQGVTTRAVEDVRNTLNNVLTCLQTGGRVYLMKGPNVDPEIKLAEKECSEFYRLEKDIAYKLPETSHERRLLIYQKVKPAPLPDFDEEPEFDE